MRGELGNRRLLERASGKAAITTDDFSTGGRLNPEQANKFIDFVLDQSVLLKEGITVRRMTADRADIDKISIGTRVIQKATEITAPGTLVGTTPAKRQLTVTEIILPVDVSFSWMEDNIERENFADHLTAMMAKTLVNDLEDLAINGDGTTSGFLAIETGWIQLLKTAADLRFDTGGSTDFRNVVFRQMLATLPAKFKANKKALRFYTSVGNEETYRYQIGQRQTPLGDSTLLNGGVVSYEGVPVIGVPYFPSDVHLLTLPENLVFGIRRLITLGQFRNERKRLHEYTWTCRVDFEYVESQAAVLAYDF
jgi:hypothetical protein